MVHCQSAPNNIISSFPRQILPNSAAPFAKFRGSLRQILGIPRLTTAAHFRVTVPTLTQFISNCEVTCAEHSPSNESQCCQNDNEERCPAWNSINTASLHLTCRHYTDSHMLAATQGDLNFPRTRTVTVGSRAFAVPGCMCWNSLPSSLKSSSLQPEQFRRQLKTILMPQLS